MATYQTHVGTLRSPNAVGSLAYTGVGFRPKALLVWSINNATDPIHPPGAPVLENFNYWSCGLSDGVTSVAITSISFDASSPDQNQGVDAAALIIAENTAGSVQHRATLTSFDADGFTLQWTNILGSERRHYGYLAIGGTDVSCAVGTFAGATAAGAQAVTGLSFRPAGVLFLPVQNVATSTDRLTCPAMGMTDGVRQGASCVFSQDTGGTSLTRRYQRIDKCLALQNVADGTVLAEAALTSLDAAGFTVNWTTAPAAALRVFYLAFAGIPFQVGTLTAPTTSGAETVALPFRPGALLMQSVNAAASTAVQTENSFSVGAGSGTYAHAVWLADKNGVASVQAARGQFTEAVWFAAAITGATTNALLATAVITAFAADGVTLAWTATDAVARQVIYAVWGATPLAGDDPVYVISIGETEINPLLATFRIQETIDAPDTLIADIESLAAPYFRPTIGQSVYVTENGVRVFGGSITGVREQGFSGPNGGDLVVEVQATSYQMNAGRRVITKAFSQGAPETIGAAFAALVTDYYGELGVTLHPDQVGGPDLPAATFERARGDAVNKQLAASVGYLQAIDFENRLRAWAPGDVRAPEDYDEDVNPDLLTGDIQVDRQLQNGYANRVILVGKPITIPDHQDHFTGDGVTDTFPITYKVAGPYPYFVDGAVAFGIVVYPATGTTEAIGGVETPAGYQWEYDPIAQTIRRRLGPVAAGVPFYFPYHGLFIPEGMAEDAAEIAAYGLWEHVEEVTAVTTTLSAQGYADALLAEKLASKEEIVTLQTRALGFHPGQTIAITSALRLLAGDYLITQVDTGSEGGVRLLRSITATKSQNNNHDWRRVYQQWAGASAGDTGGSSGTSSTTSGAGAGTGLHATTHQRGGMDPIKLDDLAAPEDNADLNASTTAHGLLLKLSGSDLQVLRGDGTWGLSPLTSGVFAYTFNTITTEPPASQRIRFNAAHPYTAVTKLWADFSSSNSEDLYWGWMRIRVGSLVMVQDKDNHLQFAEFITTGVPIDKGTYVEVPVAWASNGTALAVQAVLVRVTGPAPGGGGSGVTDAEYVVEAPHASLSAEVVLGSAVITTATEAARQAAAKSGRLFLPNDGYYLERDTGTAWQPWGPLYPMTMPVSGDFAWLNQGASTIETTRGGVHLTGAGTAVGYNLVGRIKSASPPYTITAYVLPLMVLKRWLAYGLFFRQSSDGKIAGLFIGAHSTGTDKLSPPSLRSIKATSATAFSADYAAAEVSIARPPNWLRIVDNSTNRQIYLSADGQHWQLFHTIGRTDFLTADQVGWGVITENATAPSLNAEVALLSWAQT